MVSLLSTILYFYGNFVAKMEDEGEKEMRGGGHMRQHWDNMVGSCSLANLLYIYSAIGCSYMVYKIMEIQVGPCVDTAFF